MAPTALSMHGTTIGARQCVLTPCHFVGIAQPFQSPPTTTTRRNLSSRRADRSTTTKVTASKKAPPAHVDQEGYARAAADAHITDLESYQAMYRRSVEQPAQFWRELAVENFFWETAPSEDHLSYNFDVNQGPIYSNWFKGGRTNITYNALDRHVAEGHGDQVCFLFEGNEPDRDGKMTYKQVLDEVCRVSNWLKSQGIQKGDAVAIYMPMVCELPIAMLACARIGAVHSVVFGGFSSEALADRIEDCKARVVITASGVMRATKKIDLKAIADAACASCSARGFNVKSCLVYANDDVGPRESIPMVAGRDIFWQDVIPSQSTDCAVEWVESEHPLFLLYTSGSTGKPKGVVHTTGGYMVYSATTTKFSFAMQPGDVYWCTADCGWITGHSYLTYGPLMNRATAVVFEGVPSHPTPARCWEVVEKYGVKQFYTAPTAIRSLMRSGNEYAMKNDLSSLRILGTVGEPINPEAWRWYHEIIGKGKCPVVDTWWQTETAGHMIVPLPTAWEEKPGSASLPFFGVVPVLVDEKGNELEGAAEGYLCIKQSWPSAIRTVYGDQDRFETTYFAPFPGYYFTGDGARRDEDGYYWITGRVDDVINVSGHRIGTAEVESALVSHDDCAEAAVVPIEHPIKGQGIYAYVSLVDGKEFTDELKKSLVKQVREQIGAFAAPDTIHLAPHLPKTRSGKIMRRVLRKIAAKEEDTLGDVSTLADPSVVDTLIEYRGK
jgi:acetyl-CoA synthetase